MGFMVVNKFKQDTCWDFNQNCFEIFCLFFLTNCYFLSFETHGLKSTGSNKTQGFYIKKYMDCIKSNLYILYQNRLTSY